MTLEEFKKHLQEAILERPAVFKYMQVDPIASHEEICELELLLGCSLEVSHREFLQNFGGGEYGLGVLYSAAKESEWYVAEQLKRLPVGLENFIPISDNFVGDIYGFQIKANKCVPPLMIYDHESMQFRGTEFHNVFDFMNCYALRPA